MIYYDALETRTAADREAALYLVLPRQIRHARANAPAYRDILSDIDPHAITDRRALATLPVTRKSRLTDLQREGRFDRSRLFGGFSAVAYGRAMPRVFASPGPIYEPEGTAPDYYRMGRALFAAGFREGDLIHNCFSYHFTPAGSMMEAGAHVLGCTVFPGGTGQTEQQVQAMADLRANGYVGTPSFLKILLDKASELDVPLPTVNKALFGGEAFTPSLRDWFASRNVLGYQCYATADLGLIAYETQAREGLIVDEGVVVEVVRPGTGTPVPEGEIGEVLVTTLNPDYPLIRFATGDLSAVMPGACPTGRTNMRIRGWLGRADQTTKVRGMFVHPGHVADIARRFPQVIKARLVVSGEAANDVMTFKVEASSAPLGLDVMIGEAIREVTKLRGHVELLHPGALPNDGKVIEDARRYE
jgi:phenylacetate-CoA ligase